MVRPNRPLLPHVLCWLALGAYGLSFGLPAIELGAENMAFGGRAFVLCFLGGFLHFHGHNLEASFTLNPVPFLAWAANPLFWCGTVLAFRARWRWATLVAL